MGGAFGGGVRGPGVERGGFRLRRRGGSEHFRRPSLVVFDVGSAGCRDVRADSFEEAEGSGSNDVGGVIRDLEGNGDVGLGSEVVNLVGVNRIEPTAKRRCIS